MDERRGPIVASNDDRAVEFNSPGDADRGRLSRDWIPVLQSHWEGISTKSSPCKWPFHYFLRSSNKYYSLDGRQKWNMAAEQKKETVVREESGSSGNGTFEMQKNYVRGDIAAKI